MDDQPVPELPATVVGDGLAVSCVDGRERPYLNLDAAASTSALPAVAERVQEATLRSSVATPPKRSTTSPTASASTPTT